MIPSTRIVLEGRCNTDRPHGWLTHYRLDGKWIRYWMENRLKAMREGQYVRITVETFADDEA